MSELALVVLGAIVGALGTGAATWWEARTRRQESGIVAARLLLGDLYIAETMLEAVAALGRWPDQIDLTNPLSNWKSQRESLAGGVKAPEWAAVDTVFSELHRISLVVQPGKQISGHALTAIVELSKRIPNAKEVALKKGAKSSEREQLNRAMEDRRSSSATLRAVERVSRVTPTAVNHRRSLGGVRAFRHEFQGPNLLIDTSIGQDLFIAGQFCQLMPD